MLTRRTTIALCLVSATALSVGTVDPGSSRATPAVGVCSDLHWRRPSVPSVEQPLSPFSSAPADSAFAVFQSTLAHAPSIVRRYRPETWGRGRIALGRAERSTDVGSTVRFDVAVRAGPARLRGAASVHVHTCAPSCGAPGQLVALDFRDSDGDLRGLVDWIGFELCLVSDPRPGWATMRASVMYIPGARFPSGTIRARRHRVEQFLGAQVSPFVTAVRDEYRLERTRRATHP